MSFRFDEELIELIKIKAKAQKRSLNNYLEVLMAKDVGKIRHEETEKALQEALNSSNLEKIEDVDAFMKSL